MNRMKLKRKEMVSKGNFCYDFRLLYLCCLQNPELNSKSKKLPTGQNKKKIQVKK